MEWEAQLANERSGQVAWERSRAGLAAAAAAGSGLLIAASLVGLASVSNNRPLENPPASLRFFDAHLADLVLTGVANSIGVALLAFVAYYLWRATRLRNPGAPSLILVTGLFGPLVTGAAGTTSAVALAIGANSYVQREYQTIKAAEDVFGGPALQVAGVLGLAGTLALGFWFVLGSLYAMRVGLLPRAMGIVGVMAGPLYVLLSPVLIAIPFIIALWLVALGALFAGWWPGGRPTAWETGEAMPWPSAVAARAEAQGNAVDVVEGAGNTSEETGQPQARTNPRSKRRRGRRR